MFLQKATPSIETVNKHLLGVLEDTIKVLHIRIKSEEPVFLSMSGMMSIKKLPCENYITWNNAISSVK